MVDSVCSHAFAHRRLQEGDYYGALRVATPMMQVDAEDFVAWYLAARAAHAIGHAGAVGNLRAAAVALARSGKPMWAVHAALHIDDAATADETLAQIATIYCADSSVITDMAMKPPALPVADVEPLPEDMADDAVLAAAQAAMAVCWGQAQLWAQRNDPVPAVPLFSLLQRGDFVAVARCFEPEDVPAGTAIIEQGALGDAMYWLVSGRVQVTVQPDDRQQAQPVAELGPGAFFGEMALVTRAPRAATVTAMDDVCLLRATKRRLDDLARRVPAVAEVLVAFCHKRMLENVMRISPVLAPVPPALRPDLIARWDTGFFPAGQTIIRQGTPGKGLYLVVSGSVSVLQQTDDGTTVLVARLGSGDLFGEISLIMRKPATASVVADEDTAVLVLPGDDFRAVLQDFPQLLKGVYDIALAREMENQSILGMAPEDVSVLI